MAGIQGFEPWANGWLPFRVRDERLKAHYSTWLSYMPIVLVEKPLDLERNHVPSN